MGNFAKKSYFSSRIGFLAIGTSLKQLRSQADPLLEDNEPLSTRSLDSLPTKTITPANSVRLEKDFTEILGLKPSRERLLNKIFILLNIKILYNTNVSTKAPNLELDSQSGVYKKDVVKASWWADVAGSEYCQTRARETNEVPIFKKQKFKIKQYRRAYGN